jgi:hypothetical protein
MELTQSAPWPTALEQLVKACVYRPGWHVRLIEDLDRDLVDGQIVGHGTTLVITTLGYDSYHPEDGQRYAVHHYFIVPAATYDAASWQRWLFEQYVLVETHEAMEFFTVDGARPYAPNHGPGRSPYVVHEYATETDRRTRFTGELVDS